MQTDAEVNLEEYLCAVDPPEDTLALSTNSADESSFHFHRDVSSLRISHQSLPHGKSSADVTENKGVPKSSNTYSIEKSQNHSTHSSVATSLVQDSPMHSVTRNRTGNQTKGSFQEGSVNLMNFDSPNLSAAVAKPKADVTENPTGYTKGNLSKLLSLSSSHSTSLHAADILSAKLSSSTDLASSERVSEPNKRTESPTPTNNSVLQKSTVTANDGREKSHSVSLNKSGSLNTSNNCSISEAAVSNQQPEGVLDLHEAVTNTTLSKSINKEAEEIASTEVVRATVCTSTDMPEPLSIAHEYSKPEIRSPVNQPMNLEQQAVHATLSREPEHNVLQQPAIATKKAEMHQLDINHPHENQRLAVKSPQSSPLPADKPEGKENVRPVSPIVLRSNEGE